MEKNQNTDFEREMLERVEKVLKNEPIDTNNEDSQDSSIEDKSEDEIKQVREPQSAIMDLTLSLNLEDQ